MWVDQIQASELTRKLNFFSAIERPSTVMGNCQLRERQEPRYDAGMN